MNLGQAYGWYAQAGKYVIPRKLELAVRYGFMDPSTLQTHDQVKEFGATVNYSFDGTYNNRLVIDYSNITQGRAGGLRTDFRLKASLDSAATPSRTGLMCNTSFISKTTDANNHKENPMKQRHFLYAMRGC